MEFTRSYNAFGSKSRLMHNYWNTTFDRFVILPAGAGLPALVRRPDGMTVVFSEFAGVYTPYSYFEYKLLKTASGWQFTDLDQTVELYDSTGKLLTVTDSVGRNLSMTYSTAGNLTQVTANTGETLTFTYNSFNQIATMTDNSGRVWTYAYNSYSNLLSVARPDTNIRYYGYHDPSNPYLLTALNITNYGSAGELPQSQADIVWTFDGFGRAISNYITGRFANTIQDYKHGNIAYLPDGSRIVTDSLGRQTTYQTHLVNGRSFVDSAIGPSFASCGLPDSNLEYDIDMNVTARTAFGRRTEYGGFDSKGQYGFMVEAAGTVQARRTDFVYDARFIGKPARITTPSISPGYTRAVDIGYDAAGNITSQSISGFRLDGTAISRTTTYQYAGPFGQLTQIDGARTDVLDITKFEYDATTKRLLRVTSPDGIIVRNTMTYTLSGQLASEIRPNGLKLTYAYIAGTNLLQKLIEAQGTSTRTTTWTYNSRKYVSGITYSDGINADFAVTFDYTLDGDLTAINYNETTYSGIPGSSPSPVMVGFARDTEGNVTREMKGGFVFFPSSPKFVTQQFDRTFDAYNRVDHLINATGTTDYDYHPDGTLTKVTDGKGQITSYEYDQLKRMTRAIQPGLLATNYAYDIQDNLIQITDPNQSVTRYEFDDLGNRLSIQSPDTGVAQYRYDDAGNLVQNTDAKGQITTRLYSAGNRLLSVDRVGVADDETYTYDSCANGIGKLCRIDSGNAEIVAYEYDGFGRPSKVQTLNGAVSYTYDARDNVASILYPSGRKILYSYNSASQVTQVSVQDGARVNVLAGNIINLPLGPAQSWTYGNNLLETRIYNTQYLPTQQGVPGKFTITYPGYDGNANLTQRVVDGQIENYSYDELNRLKTASGPFGLRSYDYDAVGNRTRLDANGIISNYAYQPNSNRLASDSNGSFTLDANGNTTQRADSGGQGTQFGFTARNQLKTATTIGDPNGAFAVYVYNALGQRTIKGLLGTERRFVYGLDGKLLSESLADGSIVEEVVYLNGQPLALLGQPYHPVTPPVIDAVVDDPAGTFTGTWTVKNLQGAYGGKYRVLTIADPYNDSFSWNWQPTISGMYDVWVWWDRKPTDGTSTTYVVDSTREILIKHATQTLSTWASLGRLHLTAGRNALLLHEYYAQPQRGSPSGTVLVADAARFKLIEQDTGQEGNYRYVLNDQLGTPQAVTDRSGNIIWRAVYDPFGAATVNSDPDGNGQPYTMNLRFPGQYYDAETGLYDNYFRIYDPASGRYRQSDPIGLAGGISTFAYVGGNPLSFVDPYGLDALVIAGGYNGGWNPFGHVGMAVTGNGMYSYGNGTRLGSGVLGYIMRQSQFRNQTIVLIPSTLNQDSGMMGYFGKHPGMDDVGKLDNCAVRTNSALMSGNVPVQGIPFPGGTIRDAASLPGATSFFIPQGGQVPQALLDILPGFESWH